MSLSPSPPHPRALGGRGSSGLWLLLAILALWHCSPSPPSPEPAPSAECSTDEPVRLEAGQLLHAFVEQDGTDVVVRLLGPGAEELVKVDGPSGAKGEEELAAIAERSDSYQIRVSWICQSATGEPDPGRYRLRTVAPKPAVEADRLRVEALRFTQDAVNEMAKQDPKTLPRQAGLREQALDRWRRLDDRKWEAETLYQLGLVRFNLSEYELASRLLLQAAEIRESRGDLGEQGEALNETGRCFRELNRPEDAKQHFENALALARQAGDRDLRAMVVNNLGSLHTNLGDPRAALRYLEESRQLARDMGKPLTEGFALINLGIAHENLGETDQALRYYNGALNVARKLKDGLGLGLEVMAWNNLGDTYHSLGAWDISSRHFQRALELNPESQAPANEATILNNLGMVSARAGRTQEAFKLQEQALTRARDIGDDELQAATLTNQGFLYLRVGRPALALDRCREALPLAQDKEQRAWTLLALGTARRELGDLAGARADLEEARTLSQKRQDSTQEAGITLELARVERASGDLQKADQLASQAIEIVESIRGRVRSQDLRATFLAFKQPYYELSINILMKRHGSQPNGGFAARALELSERAKARSLLDILTEAVADIRGGDDLTRERELRGEVLALERYRQGLIGDKASTERVTEATRRLDEKRRLHRDVESRLKRSSPQYWALTNPEPLSARQLRSEVGRESLLLEYSLGEERSYLWMVTADSIESFVLPSRSEIERTAQLFYRQLTARNDFPEGESTRARQARIRQADLEAAKTRETLSAMILPPFEPLRSALLGELPILAVTDGSLHYIPFASLSLPASATPGGETLFLFERHEITHLPSASVLSVLRRKARPTVPRKTVAVLADPVFRPQDPRFPRKPKLRDKVASAFQLRGGTLDLSRLPRLVHTEKEARAIQALVPSDQIFLALGFKASVATATSGELARYRFVHFATHGWIDSLKPEQPSLVLSRFDPRGAPDPKQGMLSLSDIYNLDLNADLVVLSACRTALGKEIRGEGLVGLTRGFMYAGADRVLASLWNVEDRATADLMKNFYHGLLKQGMRAPEALRQAQRKLARGENKEWRSPYYWAGFSLQGEPR
ncbi:MAG TPA: CHAT domain-containing protein [Thermoanaerobaculia bacterium]|nr:CHAT domain-containing protein [Thermoanaerobaculia bacterium]